MDPESLKKSISEYKEQLKQIETALSTCNPGIEKNDLLNLKSAIEELIGLTQENVNKIQNSEPSTSKTNPLDDEYMLFMQEMAAEGVESNSVKKVEEEQRKELEEDLKSLEGMKCQAPHVHSWGDKVYHNALVCGVINPSQNQTFNDIQVRIMFTNPTHQEMLPCPYFLEHSNCKFSDEHCRYSHGEIVPFSSLQEYKEPNFQDIKVGSMVLAKSSDNLWHRAILRKITTNECFIKFESNRKEISVPMKDILPLEEQNRSEPDSSNSEAESDDDDKEWLIQKSLLSSPPSQALGDWEKHTKGIGSKLMQQMGYITGTGLGKYSDGRLDPVEAIVLPYGKSLDHCMNLKELAGGDENLFSVERKLKKQQKMQEALNKKHYKREKKKKDIFEFLNNTLTLAKNKCNLNESKNKKEELKKGSVRDLNVKSFKIEEDIKKVEYDICKIKNSLTRHNNPQSTMHQNLKSQLLSKQAELSKLKDYARNVKTEQKFRKEKQQMSVF